ncbi:MAG: hypothetical protein ACLFSE_09465 [Spirochaetia bacterium]
MGYEKQPSEWVQFSHGVKSPDGSKLIYLRYNQKYHKPKGLFRFPDGGRVKKTEKELAFYIYDYSENSTKKIVPVAGHPGNPPNIFISWKKNGIAYWLNSAFNKNYIPSVSWSHNRGIFFINTMSWKQHQVLPYGEIPELSPDGTQAAFLRRTEADSSELCAVNIDGANLRILMNLRKMKVNRIEWAEINTIFLHTSVTEKKVYQFNFSDGRLIPAVRDYHHTVPRISRSELKEILREKRT